MIGKFSVRLVPDMDPEATVKLVQAHVDAQFAKIGSPNTYKVGGVRELAHGCIESVTLTSEMVLLLLLLLLLAQLIVGHAARAWKADFDHPNYVAGRRATKNVGAVVMVRCGG